MGERLICKDLQNFGTGRAICRELGIFPEEWELKMTAFGWGIEIIKSRDDCCEEITVNSCTGNGDVFDGTVFSKRNGHLHMYRSMKDYRKGVRM